MQTLTTHFAQFERKNKKQEIKIDRKLYMV